MANGSYLMALATTQMLTVQANHLEMRLLKISEEKNLKHLQQSAEISRYSSEMTGLVEAKRDMTFLAFSLKNNGAECEM